MLLQEKCKNVTTDDRSSKKKQQYFLTRSLILSYFLLFLPIATFAYDKTTSSEYGKHSYTTRIAIVVLHCSTNTKT